MKKLALGTTLITAAVLAAACGSAPVGNNSNSKNANSGANKAAANAAAPSSDMYSAVYALKGPRMPDDAKLAEQKREFANTFHVNLKKAEGVTSMNWDEKFKDPANMKLEDGEQVVVITFASAEGGKIEKGVYEATDAADAVEKAAKDKPLAIIHLITSSGAKRLKGKVKVNEVEKMLMYSFEEKPDAPKLDSLSYGAPFKN